MWNFISFCLSLWYSVDVFAHGTLASSTTSPAYRTAACYISMPSWVSLTSFRIMSFIHDDIIMLTLRPLSYSLAGSTVTQGKPRESLSPLPPSHSVCLSLSHRDTPPPPPQLDIAPPAVAACREPVILCGGSPVRSHAAQTKHCSVFSLLLPSLIGGRAADTKANSMSTVHFVCCLPSRSYLCLGLSLPLPTFSPSPSPSWLTFCICPVSTEY